MITDPETMRKCENALMAFLPKDSDISFWSAEWQSNGNLRTYAFFKTQSGLALFRLTFDPYKALIAFTLDFIGYDSQLIAEKHDLRNIIDDLLWNSLPHNKSLFELSLT